MFVSDSLKLWSRCLIYRWAIIIAFVIIHSIAYVVVGIFPTQTLLHCCLRPTVIETSVTDVRSTTSDQTDIVFKATAFRGNHLLRSADEC